MTSKRLRHWVWLAVPLIYACEQPATDTDPAIIAIDTALADTAQARRSIAALDAVPRSNVIDHHIGATPDTPDRPLSIRWHGPLPALLQSIALATGVALQVPGTLPATELAIDIDAHSLADALTQLSHHLPLTLHVALTPDGQAILVRDGG